MQSLRLLLLLTSFLLVTHVIADTPFDYRRSWTSIKIPNAKCGDGADYRIFFSAGSNPHKLTFDFMGGGACWNLQTCFGPTPMTWIHPLPTVMESGGLVSLNPKTSPIADHSVVFFPYCNGDLHLGDHTAIYHKIKVRHHGKRNVRMSIDYLIQNQIIDFAKLDEFVAFGYSAGALGTLAHAPYIETLLPKDTKRYLIADSPGLHFGNRYLDRFSPEYVNDIKTVFKLYDMDIFHGDGNVAKIIPRFCEKYPHWTVMTLQATKDIVMSSIFGKISPENHKKLVLGKDGIYTQTMNTNDKCIAFIPDNALHTFLFIEPTIFVQAGGKTVRDFIFDVMEKNDTQNYFN